MQINISVKDIKYRGILKTNNINIQNVSQLANCIRFLAIDAVQKANSGHPGMPMGMADIATILYEKHLKFDPNDPKWIDRDRFILSNGHGSMLLYACLYLSGYKDINLDDIKNFRQLKSPTAGHPEFGELDGIETTTGPLSQGLSNGVGFAMAEKRLSSSLGENLINHYTYVFAGDGCLMEGLSHEACSLAGHLKLNKLIVFFDDNSISIDGPLSLSSSDDVAERFKSYDWNVLTIDGHNHEEINGAIMQAKNSNKPTLICCKTKIGFGSPNKVSTSSSHGSPLGSDEIDLTRKNLDWDHDEFIIPDDLLNQWRGFAKRNTEEKNNWENKNKNFLNSEDFKKFFNLKLENKTKDEIINFKKSYATDKTKYATRKASEKSLELLNNHIQNFIGGSADLTGSNNTKTNEMDIFNAGNYKGSYVYYGIREHAMAGVMNGLVLHGGIRAYGGTFLVFSDYCRPSIRLAALMNIPAIYVMTHDSIGLGEDGPTHQPVEHLASLRTIPNLKVIRPCDMIETIESWEIALETKSPTILALTRQGLPTFTRESYNENMVNKGAYVIKNYTDYHASIFASGSEVEIAFEASNKLQDKNINLRVISFPSMELFENQNENYKKEILGKKPLFAVEAGVINGWEKYINHNNFIGMTSFGESGPYKDVYKHFGITSDDICEKIQLRLNL
ncbi:transketolase [Alphaproteobacteria bacterium]|nr:transketolase [Alphaproteobacteria bacterium]